MSDKVVYLAFSNADLVPEIPGHLACKHCRNKAFAVIYQGEEAYPVLQCTACGAHIGRIGWASE